MGSERNKRQMGARLFSKLANLCWDWSDTSVLGHIRRSGPAVLRAMWYLRRATKRGRYIRIWGRPIIVSKGAIVIDDYARLISTTRRLELAVADGGRLEIGHHAFINYGCSIGASELIRIGPRCRIGTDVIMMDNNYHCIEPERRDEMPVSQPIVLEENVWLGSRVIVLPGVTIGAHSVVGAGSVVSRSIPPRTVAVGQPARVVRSI